MKRADQNSVDVDEGMETEEPAAPGTDTHYQERIPYRVKAPEPLYRLDEY